MRRVALAVVCSGVLVAAWGAIAVGMLGWVWPYPLVLPENVSAAPDVQQAVRLSLPAWYDHSGGVSGAETAVRVGSLRSALLVGSVPIYTLARARSESHQGGIVGYLLVWNGTCDVMFISQQMG